MATDEDFYFVQRKFTQKKEGGYSNHPNDSGGPTMYGVSQKFLKALWIRSVADRQRMKDLGLAAPFDVPAIKAITRGQAEALFKYEFWDNPRISDLAPLPAMLTYDMAVNAGAVAAIKNLQRAVNKAGTRGVKVDGIIGPITLDASRWVDSKKLVITGCRLRREHYEACVKRDPKKEVFMNGWLNRLNDLEDFLLGQKR